jgi:predicted ATPase
VDDLRRGRGQVVSIVGEAGIGKTRVKAEVRDSHSEGVRWLEGRCQSYAQNTSYSLIVQILRSALGLRAAETPAIARTKLRVALRALAGERAEQVLGALAHLLGVDLGPGAPAVPPDPRTLQSQIVLATRAILEGLAQRGPLVAAIEDLHWADAASVELLPVLLELTDFQPLMVLVTSRPETEGNAWTFRLHAERDYGHRLSEVRLAPLGAADSERLADNLLRVSELPDAIRRRILERAEGNPFFLEELIRALIEQGVLRRDGERWVVAENPERWPLPTTLRGLLAARIDRLPAPAKAVVQRAAVIGRFFEYRTLRALDDEPGELDRALPHLLRAELIREWARLPERQYVFKHALTQEAAYASIVAERRKALHARVAGHLEEAPGQDSAEHAAVLARHWDHAENWERAPHYTVGAAKRAHALYARPEARAHYRRALELLRRLPPTEPHRLTHADVAIEFVQVPGWAPDEAAMEAGLRELEHAAEHARTRGDTGRLCASRPCRA